MLGSNSADYRRQTACALAARRSSSRGTASGAPTRKAAYDPDGTTDLATLVSRANDDFGQAERRALPRTHSPPKGSPVYLYRFFLCSDVDAGNSCEQGPRTAGEIAYVFGTLSPGRGGCANARGLLAVSRRAHSYWVNFAKNGDPNGSRPPNVATSRAGKDQVFEFRPDGTAGAGPDPAKHDLTLTRKATDSGKRADF